MDDLIIRVLQGHASAEEISKVRVWRTASPDNEAFFQDLSRIWTGLPDLDIETITPTAAAIRARAEAPATISIESRRLRRPRIGRSVLAVAASIALLVLTADVVRRLVAPEARVLQIQQLATGASETLMTQLSDGTAVFLAPNSTLHVSQTPGVREVWLEGRAFFGVAKHGEEWPFVVRSDRGMVHVLGTRFEFSSDDEHLRVVVLDGRVDFTTEVENVQLGAGQMSLAGPDASAVVVEIDDLNAVLGWMGTTLVFRDTPLADAAREIERVFDAEVEVRGNMGRETISGGFKDRTFREVVTLICRVLSAECVINDARAVISAAEG